MPNGPDLYLVGFMGCGKSTVGPVLAERWECAFVDSDLEVEKVAGMSISRIFVERGAAAFRALERTVLEPTGDSRRVVAAGGGAFADSEIRRWMRRRGRSVWLDAPLELIRQRLAGTVDRPLWPRDPLAQRALYERRRALYALADRRVAVEDGPPERVARWIENS